MNKKLMWSLVVSFFAMSGIAHASPTEAESAQNALLQAINNNVQVLTAKVSNVQPAIDPTSFCYQNGKAFSEGAKFEGQTCARKVRLVATPGETTPPLYWDFRK